MAAMGRAVSRNRTAVIVAVLLAALVAAAFRGVWNNGFAFDDAGYIVNNRHLDRGLTRGGRALGLHQLRTSRNWHPLTWLSHLLDVTLFGLGPAGRTTRERAAARGQRRAALPPAAAG